MENDNVVSGLMRRRQEIADKLDTVQSQVRQLILDLDAIDTTIKLFRPHAEIGAVRVEPLPRRHVAVRNESSRLIYRVLREAEGAMTTREIVRAMMEARGHEHSGYSDGRGYARPVGDDAAAAPSPWQGDRREGEREEHAVAAGSLTN